ncbi:putative Zn-dependent peptidase [Rubricella aquisinus]|uniref:Putative Zn-dependent peptidase n=1 Tax=Rubricella aquisinus TaxID=2028108 RepID=A0A840WPR0_9RHOB|nr:pitrilysin family protein [Rubricella aquisinus]MBB5516053.1 putative Zn-dependent peptidase [Rubricella aquisinus]
MTVNTTTLANGFRIVTEHMPGLKSASLGIWVMAGGRHERIEENGIAHFLEHMAFKGTARRSSLEIAETIENVGGYINAYTSREMTAYYARILEEDVALAFDVISDIVLNPAFDPREIETERGVILSEIGQSLDTPDDVIFDWLQEASYPEQPMGRTILGPAERVRAFQAENFRAFTARHYRPERLILSAAGAVDHDQIVKLAEAVFGGLTAGIAPDVTPASFKGSEARHVKSLEQAHFALALEGAGYRDPAFYDAQVLAMTLGGGMSSRLFQEAREKRGLCYSIFAQAGAYADTGTMMVYSGTSGEDVAGLAELVVDEIRRAGDGLTPAEIDRAKTQMKAGMLMGLESPSSRAERLARMLGIWGRVIPLDETVARIDAVNADTTRAYAERLRGSGQAAMALYGPVADAPALDALTTRLAA